MSNRMCRFFRMYRLRKTKAYKKARWQKRSKRVSAYMMKRINDFYAKEGLISWGEVSRSAEDQTD